MRRFWQKFWANESAVAFIEFAFVSPFMLLLLLGSIEMTRYFLIIEKVQKAVYVMTDIVGQYPSATVPANPPIDQSREISVARLNAEVFAMYDRMMAPYGSTSREMAVITSVVHKTNGTNYIQWAQITNVGSLTTDVKSIVTNATPVTIVRQPGTRCQAATFNAQITNIINPGGIVGAYPDENMIIGEVFYRYQPILGTLLQNMSTNTAYMTGPQPLVIQARTISRRIFLHPRYGDLLALPPTSPAANNNACPA